MNVPGSWKSLQNLLALILSFGCAMVHCAHAQNNVVYTPGTRVLVDPIKVYLIYWLPPGVVLDTSVPDGVGNFQTLIQGFLKDVPGSEYFNIITQYSGVCSDIPCVAQNFSATPVALRGTWVDTQAYPQHGLAGNAGT